MNDFAKNREMNKKKDVRNNAYFSQCRCFLLFLVESSDIVRTLVDLGGTVAC